VLALIPDPAAAFMTRMTSDWELSAKDRVRVVARVTA
jgi:hypothetical protein